MIRSIKNKKEWIEIVQRWDSEEIQDEFFNIVQAFRNKKPKYRPHITWFIANILSFVSLICYNAYDYDNMTYVLYSSLSRKLLTEYDNNKIDFKEELRNFNELISLMPKGFVDWCNGSDITIKKATEFLDFLSSGKFRPIMRIISEKSTNWPPKDSFYRNNSFVVSLEDAIGQETCERLATFGNLKSTYKSIIISLMDHADSTNFQPDGMK